MSKTKGLKTPEEMKPKGKKTGKVAKLTFQYDGKIHQKGEEVLGLDEKQLKEVAEKGLVE